MTWREELGFIRSNRLLQNPPAPERLAVGRRVWLFGTRARRTAMLIATGTQVFSLEEGTPTHLLTCEGIRCLAEGVRFSAVGLGDGQVVLLADGRAQPRATGMGDPVECVALLSEEPLQVLLGTEPPHLYRLDGEEGPARRLESFAALNCRRTWYTPWGGPPAVRSLARSGDWVFADIHVGSIMRSPDRGATWEPVTPDLHPDVHQVAAAPGAEGRLYANTADAVFASDDYGLSWEHRAEGLENRYGRALAVHPRDPGCLLASVSKGPGGRGDVQGKLYFSGDAGRTWTRAVAGFPEVRGNIDTFHLAFDAGGIAWAAVEDQLYCSEDGGRSWSGFWQAPEAIAALACASPDGG